MKFEKVQKRFSIPHGATADTVAEQVRQILSMRVSVTTLVISAGGGEGSGEIVAEIMVPVQGPPHGEVADPDPESVWELLDKIPLEQSKIKKPRLSLDAIRRVSAVMMEASRRGRAPLAWLVQDQVQFSRWLKVDAPEHKYVTQFLGLPLIVLNRVPPDKMIMLCGRSNRLDPLKAEWGYVVALEEESDVGEEAVQVRGAGTDQA